MRRVGVADRVRKPARDLIRQVPQALTLEAFSLEIIAEYGHPVAELPPLVHRRSAPRFTVAPPDRHRRSARRHRRSAPTVTVARPHRHRRCPHRHRRSAT